MEFLLTHDLSLEHTKNNGENVLGPSFKILKGCDKFVVGKKC